MKTLNNLLRPAVASLLAVCLVLTPALATAQKPDPALAVKADALKNPGKVTNKPLHLTRGGTAENPAVFDGEGMIIDLGTEMSPDEWVRVGDVLTSKEAIYGPKPIAPGQHTGLFVDEVAITVGRDLPAERARPVKSPDHIYLPPEALAPGTMGCLPDGRLYFRWPTGKEPEKARIIKLPKPATNGVTISCSHIIIKNVTAKHASNDGFNIHNRWEGIRLENVTAMCNADEGISAHGDVQMDVEGTEIAWNGSSEGGVADVDRSRTTYKNCRVHHNVGAAFKFSGKEHRVTDTVISRNKMEFTVAEGTVFTEKRITRE